MFALPYLRGNSEDICNKISFCSFLRKMLMSEFLLRFKANYFKKKSVTTPIFLCVAKIYLFCVVLTWHKDLCISSSKPVNQVFMCENCDVKTYNNDLFREMHYPGKVFSSQ